MIWQCHSQGVAFGDLSRLVSQTWADQEETRAYAREETGPHPSIRPELLDASGNLRARDIGITWQDGDTFLHGVRITGQKDDMEDNHRRPATAAPYPPCPEELEDARRQPAMSTPYHQSHERPLGGMSTPGFPRLTRQHTTSPDHARKDVPPIDRQHPYNGLTAKASGGQLGSVISEQ